MKKIINIKHHLDDYECMWNGIEDIYMDKTGSNLPPKYFFLLSGFGTFCYMNTPKGELKKLIAFGDGRTKKMYSFLCDKVGFSYKINSYKSGEIALANAKKEIDKGYPVILGALDMFYLPYFEKIYNVTHIPFHYVMMIGYDEEKRVIYLNDCGRSETIEYPYDLLYKAMDCKYPGLSNPNTIIKIRMDKPNDLYDILVKSLRIRREEFLNSSVNFCGLNGYNKFIKELPLMKSEIGENEYKKLLRHFLEFSGSVPTIPNKLLNIEEPDKVTFVGGFDKMRIMMKEMGRRYNNKSFIKAVKFYSEGEIVYSELSNIIIDYLLDLKDETSKLPLLFSKIRDALVNAYNVLELGDR